MSESGSELAITVITVNHRDMFSIHHLLVAGVMQDNESLNVEAVMLCVILVVMI
jgi:hypothetical protein